MRSRVAWVLAVALVLVLGAAGGYWWWSGHESEQDAAARSAAASYAGAWPSKDLGGVAFAENGAAEDFAAAVEGLGDSPVEAQARDVVREGSTADGSLDVSWTLPGDVTTEDLCGATE